MSSERVIDLIDKSHHTSYTNRFENHTTVFYIDDTKPYPIARFCELIFHELSEIPIGPRHFSVVIRIPYSIDLPPLYFKECLRQIVGEIMRNGEDEDRWVQNGFNSLRFYLNEKFESVHVELVLSDPPLDKIEQYQKEDNKDKLLSTFNSWKGMMYMIAKTTNEPLSKEIIELLKDCKY